MITITSYILFNSVIINPLNPELNPICYLLALLGAHNFLHVSRIRVKQSSLNTVPHVKKIKHPHSINYTTIYGEMPGVA